MPPYSYVPDSVADFKRLAEVLRAILCERKVEDVLNRIAQTLDLFIPSHDVVLWEKQGELLTPVIARGIDAPIMHNLKLRIGVGLTGLTALICRPICSNDAHLDPRARTIPDTENTPEAMFCAPLVAGDELLGVLTIYRCGDDREFSQREVDLASTFADLAAIAIDNAHAHSETERRARTDELTGIANRREFRERLLAEIAASRRHGHPLSLLMLDLDGFKQINDTCGHDRGDQVLKSFTSLLKTRTRQDDVVARLGGDEFVFLLPHIAFNDALSFAHRLDGVIAEHSAELGCG